MEFIVTLFNSIFITTLFGLLDFIFAKNNQEFETCKLAYQFA